ncbi:hypothetical protein DCCM_4854 [Desulfocucumis palustris]|uniref:Uncharacterized protein n=1 Tax=Desulfocucumis palustris TaxID=1898651 RepID=A0A2L2XHT0_9FIRM|nr:hypothetical protein DCCM_4854 [Desulfocucumis palustris]
MRNPTPKLNGLRQCINILLLKDKLIISQVKKARQDKLNNTLT